MNATKLIRELKSAGYAKSSLTVVRLLLIENPGNMEEKTTFLKEWSYNKEDIEGSIAREIYDTAQATADDFQKKSSFVIQGLDKNKRERVQTRIQQIPDRSEHVENFEPSAEGLVTQALRQTEVAFSMASEVLQKHANMTKDLMDQYHQRMKELDKRENVMSEILRGYSEINLDQDERHRQSERMDKLFETVSEVLAPVAAQKLVEHGLISPEAGALIRTSGKEIAATPEPPTNGKKVTPGEN